jgi:hypothetical protein
VTMAPDWIERLLADPDAPIDTVMRVVRGKGLNVVINALFDEGARGSSSAIPTGRSPASS